MGLCVYVWQFFDDVYCGKVRGIGVFRRGESLLCKISSFIARV